MSPVHTTNPFSNENVAVLLRIRLSSTLQRRKRSFENAPQGGAIWKRCFLKTLFSSVDGEDDAISENDEVIQIDTTGRQQRIESGANFLGRYIEIRMRRVHLSMRTEGIKAFSNGYGVLV